MAGELVHPGGRRCGGGHREGGGERDVKVAVLLMLLLVPSVSGGGFPSEHVITWRQEVHHVDALTGWDGDSISVTLTRPHTWQVLSSTVVVVIAMNTAIEGSNVQRVFDVAIDGNVLNFCRNSITTGGALAQRWAYGGGGPCPATAAGVEQSIIGEAQNWTFTNTGTATVNFLHASVYVSVQETVTTMTNFEEMTGLTGLEFLATVGLAAALIVAANVTTNRPLSIVAAVFAIVIAVLLLILAASQIAFVLAIALGLGAAVSLLRIYLESVRKKKEPKRFFE